MPDKPVLRNPSYPDTFALYRLRLIPDARYLIPDTLYRVHDINSTEILVEECFPY